MKINLTLVISEYCSACERAKRVLTYLQTQNPSIVLNVVNIKALKDNRIAITPALLINNELFSYGDIDTGELKSKLN